MRTADVWDAPDDSTIGSVADRIMRDMREPKAPNIFHYDAGSAMRGRINAGKAAHERALARRNRREGLVLASPDGEAGDPVVESR